MDRKEIKSGLIKSLGYDEDDHILEIEFNSGHIWQYTGISISTYNDMIESESIGKYFLNKIKGKYLDVKVL